MFPQRNLPLLVVVPMVMFATRGNAATPTDIIRLRLRQADHVVVDGLA